LGVGRLSAFGCRTGIRCGGLFFLQLSRQPLHLVHQFRRVSVTLCQLAAQAIGLLRQRVLVSAHDFELVARLGERFTDLCELFAQQLALPAQLFCLVAQAVELLLLILLRLSSRSQLGVEFAHPRLALRGL
jgi:hypothetical protein